MKYLISDFDDTFYTLQYEDNIEAVREFVSNGNQFVIATGRNLSYLLYDVKPFQIPISYYICNDGAMIYDKQFNLIYQKNIEQNIVEKVFEVLENSMCFTEILTYQNDTYQKERKETNKIIARISDREKAEKILRQLQEEYTQITGYLSTSWLNIISADVSKGNAIHILEEYYHWDKDNIYTIGDSNNDISMNCRYQGYAVENSVEELKKVSIKTVSNIRELIFCLQNEETL